MQRKLNEEFVKEYSRQFSEKITSDFFQEKENINGKEILNVTPSRQVNFFILKILFGNWQEEMKKLESPYFNYRDPEVRRAMVDFMNTLSQNIEMDEDHLYELMEEAVKDTLTLAVLPQKFLYDELIQKDLNTVTEKVTRPLQKYLKLYKEYFQAFFSKHNGEELGDFLDNSREFFEGIDVQEVAEEELERLSVIRPVSLEDLLETEEAEADDRSEDEFNALGPDLSDMDDPDYEISESDEGEISEVDSTREEEDLETIPQEQSYEEEEYPEEEDLTTDEEVDADEETKEEEYIDDDPVGTVSEDIREEEAYGPDLETDEQASDTYSAELENTFGDDPARDLSQTLNLSRTEEIPESDELEDEKVEEKQQELVNEQEDEQVIDDAEPESNENETDEEEDPDHETLNRTFSSESTTINDRYANEEKFTVADKLEKKKVESIMDAISVNHRYMFTKELFDGDRDEFISAISKIESSNSFDEAVEMLVQDYAKRNSWDMNSEEVKELLKIVFRKFR